MSGVRSVRMSSAAGRRGDGRPYIRGSHGCVGVGIPILYLRRSQRVDTLGNAGGGERCGLRCVQRAGGVG